MGVSRNAGRVKLAERLAPETEKPACGLRKHQHQYHETSRNQQRHAFVVMPRLPSTPSQGEHTSWTSLGKRRLALGERDLCSSKLLRRRVHGALDDAALGVGRVLT